jgi:hypothetical protein
MLFFTGIIHLLVEGTSQHYYQYLDSLEDEPSQILVMTDSEIFLFLGIIIQTGHHIRDRIRDYQLTAKQFLNSFYSYIMKYNQSLHILRFLQFTDNNAETDRHANDYD